MYVIPRLKTYDLNWLKFLIVYTVPRASYSWWLEILNTGRSTNGGRSTSSTPYITVTLGNAVAVLVRAFAHHPHPFGGDQPCDPGDHCFNSPKVDLKLANPLILDIPSIGSHQKNWWRTYNPWLATRLQTANSHQIIAPPYLENYALYGVSFQNSHANHQAVNMTANCPSDKRMGLRHEAR